MKKILEAILDPASQPGDFAALPLPESYRGDVRGVGVRDPPGGGRS